MTRRKIDGARKAKIALEALREEAAVADLAHAGEIVVETAKRQR